MSTDSTLLRSALDYLFSLERFGIKLGLETTEKLLSMMGNPERSYKTIHVAGTNGKGSTCSFLASVLRSQGYRVGLYTSPHLMKFNERIQVNGIEITDEQLIELTEFIRNQFAKAGLAPTFFEFTTGIAFEFFRRQKVDIAVIEVGMGGRLDATNVLLPIVSVITNISFDHQAHLGSTLLEIANEKAGIIKPGVPLVTGETDSEIRDVFERRCKKLKSEFQNSHDSIAVHKISSSLEGQVFRSEGKICGEFFITLLGDHQLQNAQLALSTIAQLRETGIVISENAIKEGLANATWRGRLEIVNKSPLVLVDGAHNVAGMNALVTFLRQLTKQCRELFTLNEQGQNKPQFSVLILAIASDKEHDLMVRDIVPLFKQVIVTEGSFKPMPANKLVQAVKKYNSNVCIVQEPSIAIRETLQVATKNDVIVITGSLYMIGEAITFASSLRFAQQT